MRYTLSFLFALVTFFSSAQVTGGISAFDFISQPVNPRVIALGGENVSLKDADLNLVANNPALLNEDMLNQASINFVPFFSDIWMTHLNYSFGYKNTGIWNVGFQYMNYGEFDQYTEDEQFLGTFKAKDYAFIVSKSTTKDYFSLGASLKYVGSSIASYNASAILFDVGGVFDHPKKDLAIGLTIKNAGFVLGNYSKTSESTTPFDIQLGASYKPEHMPVRFSVTAHRLNTFDISFFDPDRNLEIDDSGNEVVGDSPNFADKLIRHFTVGTELVLSDNFQLRAGYNLLRRKELKLENKGGLSGFSFGAMARVSYFEFAYSYAIYHTAGGISSLGLTYNFNKTLKTKSPKTTTPKKTKEERQAERRKALEEYRNRKNK